MAGGGVLMLLSIGSKSRMVCYLYHQYYEYYGNINRNGKSLRYWTLLTTDPISWTYNFINMQSINWLKGIFI